MTSDLDNYPPGFDPDSLGTEDDIVDSAPKEEDMFDDNDFEDDLDEPFGPEEETPRRGGIFGAIFGD